MYSANIRQSTSYTMNNQQDQSYHQNRNGGIQGYNSNIYRQGYPTVDQNGNPYPVNASQTQGGYIYTPAGGVPGQQGAPAYWTNQTVPAVPSQGGMNPNTHLYPNTYPSGTQAYDPSVYSAARPHPSQIGTLPQTFHHVSATPGSSRPHQAIHTSTNPNDLGPVGIYTCPQCHQTFDRPGRYEAHLNVHSNIRPFTCDGSCGTSPCNMAFPSAEALGSHKKKDRVQCENCGNLVAKKNMSRHQKSHCRCLLNDG